MHASFKQFVRALLAINSILGTVVAISASAPEARAQDGVTVRAQLRDSVTGRSIAEGVIELRGQRENQSERADGDGTATFAPIKSGSYVISTIRIGYRPRAQALVLGKQDTLVVMMLEPLPTDLARVKVTPNTQEIFGIVGGRPGLLAVVDAKVELAGSRRSTSTDSVGRFIFSDLKPGQYVLRITAPGFSERLATIDLLPGAAFESSHLLDPGKARASGMPGAWRDLDTRLEFRGVNSAIVSADELLRHGGAISDALNSSRELATKGLRIAGRACVFVNGNPKPNWTLDGFRKQEVKFVEVYGSNGDPSGSLINRWPGRTPCPLIRTTLLQSKAPTAGNGVTYVLIWTK
ncbi:MAG: carboxypeptidase-like regulatory domain-containing protein [Gemmatimonas sp.]